MNWKYLEHFQTLPQDLQPRLAKYIKINKLSPAFALFPLVLLFKRHKVPFNLNSIVLNYSMMFGVSLCASHSLRKFCRYSVESKWESNQKESWMRTQGILASFLSLSCTSKSFNWGGQREFSIFLRVKAYTFLILGKYCVSFWI